MGEHVQVGVGKLFGGGATRHRSRISSLGPFGLFPTIALFALMYLVGLVVLGHLFSGLRERRCGLLELPPLLRAGAYVAAVVLLVAFGPGVTKAFIYFQF